MRTIRDSPATLNFVPLSHTSLLPTKLRQPKQRRNTLGWGRYHISTKGRHFLSLAVGLRSRCFIEICNYIFGNMWLAYRTYVVNRVKANGLPTSNLNYQNPRKHNKRMWGNKWLCCHSQFQKICERSTLLIILQLILPTVNQSTPNST